MYYLFNIFFKKYKKYDAMIIYNHIEVINVKKYNLIVVGGGIAGVAAAVSAAREGISVLLIEQSGSLGGELSNALVYPFMKHFMYGGKRMLSDGIFTEMKKRFKEYGDSSFEAYKFVFDDMVTEAGVDVLFHASVFETITEGRIVKGVRCATKSGVMEFEADYFADTTGDGDLLYFAGCDYQLGREEDGLCQPMTTCFRVSGVDVETFEKERPELLKKYNEWQKEGRILNPRENILRFLGLGEGIVHFNTTRVVKLSPVDPFEISRAEIIARRQIHELMRFLKENSKAFDKAAVISIASHIGIRESRKLKGVHILTEEELKTGYDFEDSIALGNYDIDIHNPEGTGTYLYYFPDDDFYKVPYRSLLPKEYDNMLVAGRCLSATHRAHSSVRIMPICACLGEAAGVAFALAHNTTKNVHTINIKDLQEKLIEKGAAL